MRRLTRIVGSCRSRPGMLGVLGVRTLRAEEGVRVRRMVPQRRVHGEPGAVMGRKAGQRSVRPVRTLPDPRLVMRLLGMMKVLVLVMVLTLMLWLLQ